MVAAYPPILLADFAVQLLAEASSGDFSPAAALGGWQAGTRGTSVARAALSRSYDMSYE